MAPSDMCEAMSSQRLTTGMYALRSSSSWFTPNKSRSATAASISSNECESDVAYDGGEEHPSE